MQGQHEQGPRDTRRDSGKAGWVLPAALIGAAAIWAGYLWTSNDAPLIDPDDGTAVAAGEALYATHCAACHGAGLEGQPDWRQRRADGRMPAPPHDASGHTWHHPDEMLFGMVKEGFMTGRYAPPGYQSDMPAYAGVLSDEEILAVLAYIKSTWPERVRAHQARISRSAGG